MNDHFESLNSVFDVSSEIVSKTKETSKKISKVTSSKSDLRKDYEYVRGNLYSIIEKGQEAINCSLELAQETEQSRAYEVTGQLIKSVSDAAEKLIDIQKKLKDIEEIRPTSGPTNVTNAVFVGSTAELSKLLKSQKIKEKDK